METTKIIVRHKHNKRDKLIIDIVGKKCKNQLNLNT